MKFETFTISVRPLTLTRIEGTLRAAAEAEWEDEAVQTELFNLANECASRLQRIERGEFQV